MRRDWVSLSLLDAAVAVRELRGAGKSVEVRVRREDIATVVRRLAAEGIRVGQEVMVKGNDRVAAGRAIVKALDGQESAVG